MFENIHYRLCGLLAATVGVTISVHRPEVVRAVCLVRPHCTLSERLAVLAGTGCGRHPGAWSDRIVLFQNVLRFWLERGVDGIRVDAVANTMVHKDYYKDQARSYAPGTQWVSRDSRMALGEKLIFRQTMMLNIITSTKPESRDACACEHVYSNFPTFDRRKDSGRQTREGKKCPVDGVTSYGKVWRKCAWN